MKLFLQKKCKIFERWGLRPQTPVPPAAGGFAPKPPASGGWGLRPQTSPPIANFCLRAWMISVFFGYAKSKFIVGTIKWWNMFIGDPIAINK